MNKKNILTITIAALTALTITITTAITFTRKANAAETCTVLESDCNGFYYDLDGIRYNAAGLKKIADDVNENGKHSQYYDMFIKTVDKNNSGKVLIDNQTYTVYVYRTIPEGTGVASEPKEDPMEKILILHTDNNAADASKRTLTFVINSQSDTYMPMFQQDELNTMLNQEQQHSSWRDSQLRKIVNTDTFNKLPSELKQQIEPTVAIGSHEYSFTRLMGHAGNCENKESAKQECNGSNIDKLRYGTGYYYHRLEDSEFLTDITGTFFNL